MPYECLHRWRTSATDPNRLDCRYCTATLAVRVVALPSVATAGIDPSGEYGPGHPRSTSPYLRDEIGAW